MTNARPPRAPEVDPRTLSTAELISYIVSRHHAYLFAALPFVDELAARALHEGHSNGPSDARLTVLREGVYLFVRRMRAHLYDEEAVLFPALRDASGDPRAIGAELAAMNEDHHLVALTLEALRRLAGECCDATPKSPALRRLVRELADIEADTIRHIQLEKYVLARGANAESVRGTPDR